MQEFVYTKGIEAFNLLFNLLTLKKTKGGHGLHRFFQVANHDRLNEKFLRGGQGGAVFSKSAPPGSLGAFRKRAEKVEAFSS
jgi:hypothetical protein